MTILHYLAYGSNLHPVRLQERVPSARLLGSAVLKGYRLAFHMRGEDASGKGNLVADPAGSAYGAVYAIDAGHKPLLDRYEGPGYRCGRMQVSLDGRGYDCFVYLAAPGHVDDALRPYDWYKRLILLGAEYLGVPPAYLHELRRQEEVPDPDPRRAALHEALIARMLVRGGG